MHIQFHDDDSYAMKYEGVIAACYFDIEDPSHQGSVKYQDPLSFANSDRYSRLMGGEESEDFVIEKTRFATALGALAVRYPTGDHIEPLNEIVDQLGRATEQRQIAVIIDNLIELMQSL